jgi:hypothetical protein
MEELGCNWTDFHENLYLSIFRKYAEKIQFSLNMTRITDTSHEHLCTFTIISRWILLRMIKVSDKICRENQNTHFVFNNFSKPCRLWDNVEKCGRAGQTTDDDIMRRMRVACWVTKVTDTHSEYIILSTSPWQQWFRGSASLLPLCVYFLSCLSLG